LASAPCGSRPSSQAHTIAVVQPLGSRALFRLRTFYSDKAGIFRVNQKQPAGGDGYTQFGRALYELNIGIICANTSSAKGRVERAHLTLQDRLVKELRLEQISTMAAANAYAPTFIADYNRQ
jgi:hypothetical protein